MNNKVYKLAIESGIGGGSVSVFQNGKILDFRCGGKPGRKADYLIEDISDILTGRKIEKKEISTVVYSEFPGSHTGLKIGTSIAIGLQIALKAGLKSRNLFDCIFKKYSNIEAGRFLIVLPSSKSDIVWRIYDKRGMVVDTGQTNLLKDEETVNKYMSFDDLKIYIPLRLFGTDALIYKKFDLDRRVEIIDVGENLSGFLVSE